jgi:hypothetical protein
MLKLPTFFATILLFCGIVFSQNTSNQTTDAKNEFMLWGGASPDSNELIGVTKDARFGIVGLRYARIFKPSRQVALKYTVDAIPFAVLSYPTLEIVSFDNTFRIEQVRKNRYGWGISPLGLQINFRRQKNIQPFIGSSGGFVYFSKRVPSEFGAKFNFTADLGGGVQFMLQDKKAITVGYKYHHLSNGYRADDNPGFDSNLFYVGFSFFK